MHLDLLTFLPDREWAWALLLGVAADVLLGEPRRWHPLVGFGRLASAIDRRFNGGRRWQGVLAWLGLVGALAALYGGARWLLPQAARWMADGAALWFALGARSLQEHVWPVRQALVQGDLASARAAVQRIVTRDCTSLDASEVAAAAVESTLENGNDAVFGSLFWFAVGGGLGALVFRLANTLDAMWGYRTERYLCFGWAAARADDLLNWLPARLTALSYAGLGYTRLALWCWRHQAPRWDSPNAGPVMAAGAGALGLKLGGPARYHGRTETRPVLGAGRLPHSGDVGRALALVASALLMWLVVLTVLHVGLTR
ncbi:cobalamin biosynthesis protein [Aquabacterium sp. A7-Y]|uniref:CobD/CbiB family cobalamin biosynthesis protein n=1 Tax=Aquabacterium sp. A7-Y TaxID=1349605 RepID=UPI00223D16C6|nr:CobD/CbiB family cobalamin biosynthesis protein [Aquabacterium sp. A7-Y]MCW7539633.1 cobalamin biosynthesis protein [Aquabacterium sp. A7-Y]